VIGLTLRRFLSRVYDPLPTDVGGGGSEGHLGASARRVDGSLGFEGCNVKKGVPTLPFHEGTVSQTSRMFRAGFEKLNKLSNTWLAVSRRAVQGRRTIRGVSFGGISSGMR
jgi:hypothetical protein